MSNQRFVTDPLVYSGLRALAEALGLSQRRTWQLVNQNEIPAVRVGRRLLFRRDAVVEWLKANEPTRGMR